MLRYQWESLDLTNLETFSRLKHIIEMVKPEVGAFDTETSGLNIVKDKPFVIQFGFLDTKNMKGYTFAMDIENCAIADDILTYWNNEAKKLKLYLGHNVKFDMHMLTNIGHEYKHHNLSDTQFWIRYAHDALHPNEGGPVMGLKEYTTRYLDKDAKEHENKFKTEKTEIVKK